MTGQDLLTVQVCCDLSGRAIDAALGVLGLGIREGISASARCRHQ